MVFLERYIIVLIEIYMKGALPMFPRLDAVQTGKNIHKIMKTRGITVKDVQKYLGLTCPQSVYHWLNGQSIPTIDHLYALSDFFELPIDEIVRGNRRRQMSMLVTIEMNLNTTEEKKLRALNAHKRLLAYCNQIQKLKSA